MKPLHALIFILAGVGAFGAGIVLHNKSAACESALDACAEACNEDVIEAVEVEVEDADGGS